MHEILQTFVIVYDSLMLLSLILLFALFFPLEILSWKLVSEIFDPSCLEESNI